jgi:hypothetical protein
VVMGHWPGSARKNGQAGFGSRSKRRDRAQRPRRSNKRSIARQNDPCLAGFGARDRIAPGGSNQCLLAIGLRQLNAAQPRYRLIQRMVVAKAIEPPGVLRLEIEALVEADMARSIAMASCSAHSNARTLPSEKCSNRRGVNARRSGLASRAR